ncbi:hypothetical protein K505DRAFT_417244 [Melanomma pulvis-pyrius CBS 109.77]|uniref:Ankyrin n=1 Tax=Melanomma pulvis-pyrius CBS 109.77 TaxID=1314802 RepID=A0A6A6XCF1_9PLEO|nr:hypothetical protein K505DRAFT_417244 [Melanomma pulvis-pyrius CBS 109.77]
MTSESSPSSANSPQTEARPLRAETRELISTAIREDSVSKLKPALDLARSSSRPTYPAIVGQALRAAVEINALSVLAHLLENEHAQTSDLSIFQISKNRSLPVLEVLLAHGWDINARDEEDGKRLIDWSCTDEVRTRWLVKHGARVDGGEFEFEGLKPRPPPLLETCARVGSLSMFIFLQSQGAKLGGRTLHHAASAGAFVGADPGNFFPNRAIMEDEKVFKARKNVEDILRYLVDELDLDINAIDTDVPRGLEFCGTPLNYAAKEKRGSGVVKWLLGKGGNPSIRSLGEGGEAGMDAKGYAEWMGCTRVLETLNLWKRVE